jgi:hypothetical protein
MIVKGAYVLPAAEQLGITGLSHAERKKCSSFLMKRERRYRVPFAVYLVGQCLARWVNPGFLL